MYVILLLYIAVNVLMKNYLEDFLPLLVGLFRIFDSFSKIVWSNVL